MKRRKKRKSRYKAEYEGNVLNLKLEEGIRIKIDLEDNLEVGVFLAKFRQAGLGSSRELGRIFRRSASTVINKVRSIQKGSKHLIDGRKQKKRYKMEDIQAEILLMWVKKPAAKDSEIFEGLQPRLSSQGISLDLKTLKRHIESIGIAEARSQLRTKEVLVNRDIETGNDVDGQDETVASTEDKAEEKGIIQRHSRYAGQMLTAPHLYQMNFADMVKGLPSPAPQDCLYSIERVAHQLYFLYACGGKRLYELDSVHHQGFGALIGMEDNLRSSGMNKRVRQMAKKEAIEEFQKKAFRGRAGLINRKDIELSYCDTHVIEVWVNKNIFMARHGTKQKQVKAINVHYLTGSDTMTVLSKEYTQGNKRLSWAIPGLVKRAEEGLREKGRKIGTVCFDKGGISLKVLNALAQQGKGFLCWGKRTEYVKRQIKRIRDYRFRYHHKKEIRQDGKLIKVEERLADTTTHLKGLGKVRTIVVELPEVEGGERLWMHTNLRRNRYDAIEIREMMRYKQLQENFFKLRKHKTALDCFAGGRCKIKPIMRPSEKIIQLLKKQVRRLSKRVEKDQESLNEVKELRGHGLYKRDTAKREADYLNRRIRQNIEQKEKAEEKIRWSEGGKRPEFIKPRYELELEKQKILNEIQDIVILSKRESLKEFISYYKRVLDKEGLFKEEITQRMKYLDKAAIEKELFGLGGTIICDKREKRMTVMIQSQGREYFKKALEIFLHQQNKKKTVLDYGEKEKYQLHFCLSPPT
ncbi:hypothetical protein KJ813_05830 [bacterium]|nr:hypothetical protein [bacterium]MCG2707159.1 hypothetical protein [Candidatus Omnitrophota bacterium]